MKPPGRINADRDALDDAVSSEAAHSSLTPRELFVAAVCLRVDRLAVTMTAELAARAMPAVVLKGPSISNWLYRDGALRVYGDLDLLVRPVDWERAREMLLELGFGEALAGLAHPNMESEASYAYHRGGDEVDLHTTFYGIEAPSEQVWDVLTKPATTMPLCGASVRILAPGPRALLLALHATQHGPTAPKPLEDLRRAIAQLDVETWREAAAAARALAATPAFAIGLELLPVGQALARRLGVDGARSSRTALRVAGVPLAEGLENLRRTQGARARIQVVRREAFPTAAFMRWWTPIARWGRVGLVAAYAWRLAYLALHAPRALIAWSRARNETARRP